MKIACLQIDIDYGQPESNMLHVEKEINISMEHSPDVIILPELWTTGYDLTRLEAIADSEGKQTKQFLSNLARKYQVNIIGGSIAKKTEMGITNTMYSFNRQGQCISEYSKVHLFKLMDEHLYLQAGNTQGHLTIDHIPCAGFICYDIRFPEWIRKHTTKGAKIIFVVAEWPLPRLDHWRALLKSRAVENQCYVVACNRAGRDPNNQFAGHSIIIDPWGETVVEANETASSITASLDLDKVDEVRKQIPIFNDRRPELY